MCRCGRWAGRVGWRGGSGRALSPWRRSGECGRDPWASLGSVDLRNEYLKLRRNRLRPKYAHGCADTAPCGRKPGYCPDRVQTRRETKNAKTRPVGDHTAHPTGQQARERTAAGNIRTEPEYFFTEQLGGPLSPNTDYHDWKRLLEDTAVRDGRLHDARHTAGTVLMLLGVPDRVTDQIMGWEPGGAARMRARYLHVSDHLMKEVARKIGTAIWGDVGTALVDKNQDNEG